jgi:pseudoazurin
MEEERRMRFGALTVGMALTTAMSAASPAVAKEYQVAMVNRSVEGAMAFTPGFLRIAPGDTVRFVVRDKGHNAESIPLMTPTGARVFKGAINEPLVVKFTTPGLYGYKCAPHFGMGMVGLIQVGKPVNLNDTNAQLAKLPPFAKKRMGNYVAQVR